MHRLACFKSYDIRGRLGEDINADLVRRIGQAFAAELAPGLTVIGRDIRESSPLLQQALAEGLLQAGSDVADIGLCGTEEVYFATSHLQAGGGIMVTASHNPLNENGLKLVQRGSRPVTGASGLEAIHDRLVAGELPVAPFPGTLRHVSARSAYLKRLLSFVDPCALRPLHILVNGGNGAAGPTFDALAAELASLGMPLTFHRLRHEPDPTFPYGIPNPLLPENHTSTAEAVRASGADFGIAWDGDFDRCFFFDETGAFVAGEYIVGILAELFLFRFPGERIVHDPRVVWNILDAVAAGGGTAIPSRSGHGPFKERMRETGAVYGGEMSAHHYFRDFMFCDSGMIPWLMVAEWLSRAGRPFSTLLAERRARFPSSGEINFRVDDPQAALVRVEAALGPRAAEQDAFDGLSLTAPDWRLNLRCSETEPLLRLNVETQSDSRLLAALVSEVSALVSGRGD